MYGRLLHYFNGKFHVELLAKPQIGGGLYFGYPQGSTIDYKRVGGNVNIQKEVTFGQGNRRERSPNHW